MTDKTELRKWWDTFVGDGNFTEVRILGKFQYSGYFKDFDNLCKQLEPYVEMDNEQVYFMLNKINPDCYGRKQCEKFVKSPKMTTTDSDIVARTYVLIDFDPVRASGVNASDEEFEMAHKKAQEVFKYLRDNGFKDPVICQSGNGFHCIYRIMMPNDEESTDLLKRFLQALGSMFSDEYVEVDEKVFNASRISKVYGTMAKKGANIPERPWRMSRIIYTPTVHEVNDVSVFEPIAALAPNEEPKVAPNRRLNYQGGGMPFDLQTWLREHGVNYKEEKQGTSVRFTLEYCPWVDTHSERKKWDSALFLDPDGKITFNCHHSHCKNKTWFDFREFYEPDAYSRPAYQHQRQYAPQKPRYEIKGEVPELGKKWLRPSDIKKVDVTKLEGVKTGFVEIDRRIKKLHYGEVTVLSGGNAAGKSSWLNTVLLNIAEQQVPSALWSGELPESILMNWIHMAAAGKRNLRQSQFNEDQYYVPSGVEEKIDRWLDNWLLIYNTAYGSKWEQLFSDMEDVVKAGVKFIVLDNLMAMDINIIDGDKNEKQRQVILRVKKFAKDNMVHIVIVAHPRKTTAFLRKNDISGTADLQNAVDNIIIMHRVNNDFFRAGADFFGQAEIQRFQGFGNVAEIAKNRMFGVVDLLVGMHYEVESRRFKNYLDENVRYSWESEPVQSTMSFYEPNETESDLPFEAPSDDEEQPF